MTSFRTIAASLCATASFLSGAALAGPDAFHAGAVIPDYGQIATVDATVQIPADTVFKVAFDVKEPAKNGDANRSLNSAARFLNMHGEAGVTAENIDLAFVIHGAAVKDVAKPADGADNPSAGLVAALVEKGVRIYVCGQSAAYYDVATEDLLPGVDMALSAMTMHALLQQEGYTLNPF